MTDAPKKRVPAQYWIDIALDELAQQGPEALTIDALCRTARKTKGSFYAHFASHDAFLQALVAHWREQNTLSVMRRADAETSPERRLARLNELAIHLDSSLDRGMRLLAERHPSVAEAIAETEETRIAYLAGLYRTTGDFSDSEAADLATLEYAAYVGLQLIGRRRPPRDLQRLYEAFNALVARRRQS